MVVDVQCSRTESPTAADLVLKLFYQSNGVGEHDVFGPFVVQAFLLGIERLRWHKISQLQKQHVSHLHSQQCEVSWLLTDLINQRVYPVPALLFYCTMADMLLWLGKVAVLSL